MISLNPYSYIGGAVIVAAIGGSLYYQSTQIHHFHKLYDNEHTLVIKQQVQIEGMTTKQNNQTGTTEREVIKVVKGPETVKTVIKMIHDAPEPAGCTTPALPEEVRI